MLALTVPSGLQLHSVQTGSESFLQMVIQIYFMVLLVVMGGATLIAGREAEDFFNDICKIVFYYFTLVAMSSRHCQVPTFV